MLEMSYYLFFFVNLLNIRNQIFISSLSDKYDCFGSITLPFHVFSSENGNSKWGGDGTSGYDCSQIVTDSE